MLSENHLIVEFNKHIKRDKDEDGFLVEDKRILHFLKKRKFVIIYERNYALKDAWVWTMDHFHDINVTSKHLKHYKKRFAKYQVFHPEFGLLKIYKHIGFFDQSGPVIYVITVPKGKKLPIGLE